jgi:hypothetical protein
MKTKIRKRIKENEQELRLGFSRAVSPVLLFLFLLLLILFVILVFILLLLWFARTSHRVALAKYLSGVPTFSRR